MNADMNTAAVAGDIQQLYALIQCDPHVLENMDKIPFVDTPLHIAAAAGHIRFATEIVRLKPSFACKLNPLGLTPMHLALQNGHDTMVHRFVSINKELVRVKGREGLTPLHLVAETGRIEILAKFLLACPDSIQDLTVEDETALHIAVKNQQFEALQVLVGCILRSPRQLRESILNWKNESQDTILHVSTRMKDAQTVKFLIESGINVNAKNWEGSTALDIVEMRQFANAEIKNMLLNSEAKRGTTITDAPPTLAKRLTSKLTLAEKLHGMSSFKIIDEKKCSAIVAVAVLIATMTYQSALSPPGGVYQGDASATSTNGNNSTLLVGKSVMSSNDFSVFLAVNTISLLVSTVVIFILLPLGLVSISIIMALIYYWVGFIYAMRIISPSDHNSKTHIHLLVILMSVLVLALLAYKFIAALKHKAIAALTTQTQLPC